MKLDGRTALAASITADASQPDAYPDDDPEPHRDEAEQEMQHVVRALADGKNLGLAVSAKGAGLLLSHGEGATA